MLFAKRSGMDFMIVGLGNPGKKYELTRHNVGFRALDAFATQHGIRVARARFQALVGDGRVNAARVLLLKPTTFMNLSGTAVQAAAQYYNIPHDHIIVLCDDVALAPGVIRIRADGSAGGHNGLQNIIDYLDSTAFARVRIGVGQKPHPDYDMADWVLSMPSSADRKQIDARTADICDAVSLILEGRLPLAQSKYNG